MKRNALLSVMIFSFFWFFSGPAFAARIEMQNDMPIRGDFPMGPTSFDIEIDPGQSVTKQLQVDNRMGKEQSFSISIEDFQGSTVDPTQTVLLQAEKAGKYGAKEWLQTEIKSFKTQHGERQYFDVTVTVPKDADPGDHYASVLVSAPPTPDPNQPANQPNVMITSRVGALFYVRVKGPMVKEGKLEGFGVQKTFYEKPPVSFGAVYRNMGTILLRLQGTVTITDMLGRKVGTIVIKTDKREGEDAYSFNVLRDSVRELQMGWKAKGFFIGRYKATLSIQHQYSDDRNVRSVTFWILPWRIMLAVAIAIVLVFFILRYLRRNVQVSVRKKQ